MSADDDVAKKQREVGDRESAKLWRAWRTAKEMVKDRGYEIAQNELEITLSQFKDKYSSDDGMINRTLMTFSARPTTEMLEKYSMDASTSTNSATPATAEIGSIWVEFLPEAKVGVEHMRKFAHYLTTNSFHTGILITLVPITASAMKVIPAVASETRIECFVEEDLLVNITHHELVPKHIMLSRDEKKRLLERYRLKETQLPRIQVADPVAKYLGLRRGQVVKIANWYHCFVTHDQGMNIRPADLRKT
ncbi:hypothetical protein B7494_g142 [Chlorociboria aeruginascens]|nr:hypothetical protein B7494_g142 [Chlorociboria aeruginascens]